MLIALLLVPVSVVAYFQFKLLLGATKTEITLTLIVLNVFIIIAIGFNFAESVVRPGFIISTVCIIIIFLWRKSSR